MSAISASFRGLSPAKPPPPGVVVYSLNNGSPQVFLIVSPRSGQVSRKLHTAQRNFSSAPQNIVAKEICWIWSGVHACARSNSTSVKRTSVTRPNPRRPREAKWNNPGSSDRDCLCLRARYGREVRKSFFHSLISLLESMWYVVPKVSSVFSFPSNISNFSMKPYS